MDNLRHPHPYGEPQRIRGRVKLIGRLQPYCPPEYAEAFMQEARKTSGPTNLGTVPGVALPMLRRSNVLVIEEE